MDVSPDANALSPSEIQAISEEWLSSDDLGTCSDEFLKEVRFDILYPRLQ